VKRWALAAAGLVASTLAAAQVVPQEPVTVSATRQETRVFDAPAAVGVVGPDVITVAGPQVNLSESLDRVAGIAVLNRNNYAQDLQVSIRGFGARSSFGLRGIRLIVDGIPLTTPDGQGQGSSIALTSAGRIEVLRGPLALLYGNAAGGVIQVFTKNGAPEPTLIGSVAFGSFGMDREDLQFLTTSGPHALTFDLWRFHTDGYRDHSSATREIANFKWVWQVSDRTRLATVFNDFDQPWADDPLGLTRAQWQQDPKQVQPIAIQNNTGKSVRQPQIGTVLDHAFDDATTLNARVYYGERRLDNALGIPLAAQTPPTSAGAIVSFDRDYAGTGFTLAHRFRAGDDTTLRVLAGATYDQMHDDRQGYLDVNGNPGALKRNEDDYVHNVDGLLQATADFGERWSAIAGVRATHVHFQVKDHFIAPGNGDDSGTLDYRGTNPVAGVTWHAMPRLNVYANIGRGFETPTFTEIAYSNTGSGINTGLKASTSRHAELGAKWRDERQSLDAAIYEIHTNDELIVDQNVGGRSTYRNGGDTTRRGLELQHVGQWTDEWRTQLAVTMLRARFDDTFPSGSGTAAVPVNAGNRIPGTPERLAFAELAYAPRWGWMGLNFGAEVIYYGKLWVDDINSDSTSPATVLNLRAGLRYRAGAFELEPLVRVDNVTDRKYVGSVIVNEANRRFFEPALPRNWMVGITGRYRF
jgi:iron complex outermembrane receptor protein